MSQSALLRRLLRYVKPYSLLLAMALVFALLQVAMTLSAPVIIGQAVDAIVAAGQVDFIRVTQTHDRAGGRCDSGRALSAVDDLLHQCLLLPDDPGSAHAMLRAVSRAASGDAG